MGKIWGALVAAHRHAPLVADASISAFSITKSLTAAATCYILIQMGSAQGWTVPGCRHGLRRFFDILKWVPALAATPLGTQSHLVKVGQTELRREAVGFGL